MGRRRKESAERYADEEYNRLLGIRIMAARRRAGLTIQEAAERLSFSAGKLSLIETGRRRIKIADIREIAEAYGAAALELMKGDGMP